MDQKFCKKCNISKDRSNFYKNSTTKDGLQLYCKECSYTPIEKLIPSDGNKICSKCNKEQKKTSFYKNSKLKDGYHSYCIECVSTMRRIKYTISRS